ncbi:MAG: YncE family protein [Rhodospirillales bacterium]|nr:YncE family protein [Rhodospirillales bacterium]
MTQRLGHLIVSGRWDNNVAIVDVAKALLPENDRTDGAVISRPRVTPDVDTDGDGRPDAPASGQPVSILVDRDARFAYVVNHSGAATPAGAAGYQHGHPGLITVVDLAKARDPAHDGTLGAVAAFVPTGRTGPVGCALVPDGSTLLVNCGEAEGSEDGGDEITAIDVSTRKAVRRIPLRETPGHPAPGPSRHDSPHPSFGRYPNPTGIVTSSYGGGYAFVGNGGISDVSVVDLQAAMAGDPGAERHRIPVETGPFGLAASPDGRLVAVAARESMSVAYEGRTISIIDVARAAAGGKDAEVARVRVGSDDPAEQTRPFAVAFTPDGKRVVASCFRSNTISIVDVADAIAGRPAEALRIHPRTPNGAQPRPRGIAIAGGRYACVVGGAKEGSRSSLVWLLDLETGKIVSTVTGVGNETYGLDAIPATG